MDPPNVTNETPKEVLNGVTPEREKKRSSRKSKEDKSSRKKDERSIDVITKALNNVADPVEKIQLLSKKYSELHEECRKDAATVKDADKKLMVLQREKDSLQQDYTKSVLKRNRLEELCRELQRQNKVLKEESTIRAREEDEKRKEVSSKFQATLSEINTLMQQNNDGNIKLRDENLEMQKQLKTVWEQYGLREQQAEKMTKQIKLEGQLAEAKIAKAKLEFVAQREILERDKAELAGQLALCQTRCGGHEKTEEALRAQISVYYEKYDEFQNVLTKSNSVYSGFKSEMEKMSKKITRLEKDTSTWKQKWESTHKALLALAVEKKVKDDEVALQARQLEKMQKLCRTLILEKASLEKTNGKKSEEIANVSALIEDTIAAHMAVNDFVVSKTLAQGNADLSITEPQKSKEKKHVHKKNDAVKVLKAEDNNQHKDSSHKSEIELPKNEDSIKEDVKVVQKSEPEKKITVSESTETASNKVQDPNLNTAPITQEIVEPKLDNIDGRTNDKKDSVKQEHIITQNVLTKELVTNKSSDNIKQEAIAPLSEIVAVSQVTNESHNTSLESKNATCHDAIQDTLVKTNSVQLPELVDNSVSLATADSLRPNLAPLQNLLDDPKKSDIVAPEAIVPLEDKPKPTENSSNQSNKESSPNKVSSKQSKLPLLHQEKSPTVTETAEKIVIVEMESATGGGDSISPRNEKLNELSSTIQDNDSEPRSSTSPANKSGSEKKSKDGRRRTKKK